MRRIRRRCRRRPGSSTRRLARHRPNRTCRRCRPLPRPPTWAPTVNTRPRRTMPPKAATPPRSGKVSTEPPQIGARISHQPGRHRRAARQRRVPLHREQFRQPGAAGVFRQHPMPPVDRHRRDVRAAVRRPQQRRHRRPRLSVRQRIPHRSVPARRPRCPQPVHLSARHAGDGSFRGQRRTQHQRQPILHGLPRLAASAGVHGVRHGRRRRPGDRRQGRRRPASPAAATTASRSPRSPSRRCGWTKLRRADAESARNPGVSRTFGVSRTHGRGDGDGRAR